ncbi:hypothetical protein HOP50_06g44300 [Chloropicon primus]|uniref:Uncharacterized protein n=1 Tax=Chloropicon primus TaxID=1764295 RepID=A0A5B8MMK4_9CHLO|nr:hypothetical protein A3770_06p44060 [Chloropicon primus]UPR01109.1 hypothetical protein HOP50_06g44300 [Chloropicon primus]|mmetsp:Transcript_13595/g.38244  ORF Transcript_13595/g.38244 Transcript_13595/m.38244 type:complete len:133 (+) Transcript_13595:263-661(+)|eukprot:QDZ21888.1 hypothetical protein A3770_06p44060 [Chloropicon primus]
MNPFDFLDVSEEPGFPEASTTPRSIRNMENLISMIDKHVAEVPPESPRGTAGSPLSPLPGSPRTDLGSPKRARSMSGRDVWHLGKGTSGPRSYGSFGKVSRDKWDSAKPGGETVWEHILKSEKAKERSGTTA